MGKKASSKKSASKKGTTKKPKTKRGLAKSPRKSKSRKRKKPAIVVRFRGTKRRVFTLANQYSLTFVRWKISPPQLLTSDTVPLLIDKYFPRAMKRLKTRSTSIIHIYVKGLSVEVNEDGDPSGPERTVELNMTGPRDQVLGFWKDQYGQSLDSMEKYTETVFKISQVSFAKRTTIPKGRRRKGAPKSNRSF